MKLYQKIQKIRDKALYTQHVKEIRIGECVVVEGGHSTGKTHFLRKTVAKLAESGERCIFIDAMLPAGDWVKEYKLFGKNLDSRIDYFIRNIPEKFHLVIDNAEKLQDSRKLEFVLYLMKRARSAVIGCTRFGYLSPKLRARLNSASVHSLGAGTDTFDITYFMVAIMIIVIAIIGAHNLIFLAAAFRYMFQGTRMGGRR